MTQEENKAAAIKELLVAKNCLDLYFSLVENTPRQTDEQSFELKNEFDKNEEALKKASSLLSEAISNITNN